MSLKSFVTIACIFSACAKPPAYVKSADNVTKSFNDVILQERALFSLGSGGYFSGNKVEALYADYETFSAYSKEDARTLLLETVTEFVNYINQDECVRKYLTEYPVTAQNVSVSIAFVDGNHNPFDSLAQIHLYGGKIFYSTFDKSKKAYLAFEQEECPSDSKSVVLQDNSNLQSMNDQ